MITKDQLQQIATRCTPDNLERYTGPLNDAMGKYGITTPKRIQAFLANVIHESGEFRYSQEIASGEAYEGRNDLGNTQPGDGKKFKGRGPLQTTGRKNYELVGKELGVDLMNHPELLEGPVYGCLSSAYFFQRTGCNQLADADKFESVCAKINGRNKKTGMPNHMPERIKYYERAKRVIV